MGTGTLCCCSFLVLGAGSLLFILVPEVDNAWFVGSILFLFSFFAVSAVPTLQSLVVVRHREPSWFEDIERHAPTKHVFLFLHRLIMAGTFAGVFWYWASRIHVWDSLVPTFVDWSVRDFVVEAGSILALANSVESFLGSQAMEVSKTLTSLSKTRCFLWLRRVCCSCCLEKEGGIELTSRRKLSDAEEV